MSNSLFFDYFKDKLRFFLLWKENAWWPVIKGISQSLDQARDDIIWVREQYSLATCEDQFFDLYAESRGIKQFPFETLDQFRRRVIDAYQYWSSAGTASALEFWLKELNKYWSSESEIQASIIEFKDKGDEAHLTNLDWAEIYIQFNNFHVDKKKRYYVQLIINDLKRASAKILTGFRYVTKVEMQYAVAKHFTTTLKRPWQYEADRMTSFHVKSFIARSVDHLPKKQDPVVPVFDDEVTQNGKNFVRTFDSDWCFDHKEDRPAKVRKQV